MASGRQHDHATWALALPFALLWGPALGLAGVIVAGLSFLAGGLLLSPDLDTRSRAMRRWGPLQLLWWPYRRLLSHRSLFSHSPLLGMGLRLTYLAVAVLAGATLLQPLGAPPAGQLIAGARTLWQQQPALVLAALVALEASSWLHLIQDGDPWPRLPRPLRALLGRRRRRLQTRLTRPLPMSR